MVSESMPFSSSGIETAERVKKSLILNLDVIMNH